jgi:hypothetical protein
MSSLRLVHSKRHPTPDEGATGVSGGSSSSTRLQSLVDKLYTLEQSDSSSLEVFDQIVDDLLAEARGDENPVGGQ